MVQRQQQQDTLVQRIDATSAENSARCNCRLALLAVLLTHWPTRSHCGAMIRTFFPEGCAETTRPSRRTRIR